MKRRRLSITKQSTYYPPNVQGKVKQTKGLYDGRKSYYFDGVPAGRDFGASRKAEIVRELTPEQFDPNWDYKPWQLDIWADVWLRHNEADENVPHVLMEDHYIERLRREVYVGSGVPDEYTTNLLSPDGQMMYWRTSPRGRKRNSDEQRQKNGASYYR